MSMACVWSSGDVGDEKGDEKSGKAKKLHFGDDYSKRYWYGKEKLSLQLSII